jgi:hypothetical protein
VKIHNFKLFFIGFFFIALASCSSLKERAQKHLERGEYEAASTAFEHVLISSPGDTQAQAGLRKSRMGLLSENLIKVRVLRMAGNQTGAAELLEDILKKQSEWKVVPEGQAWSTQSEELGHSVAYIRKIVSDHLRDDKPLLAKFARESHRYLLDSEALASSTRQMDQAIAASGIKTCRRFEQEAKSENLYFFGRWVMRYCSYWGQSAKNPTFQGSVAPEFTFGPAKVVLSVKGLNTEYAKALESTLKDTVLNSPWHAPEQKQSSATISVSGEFEESYFERPTVLTHSYSVNVPYTDYEYQARTVKRLRTVCMINGVDYDAGSSLCRGQPIFPKYTDVTEQVQVPVTRVRAEPRTLEFRGMRYEQEMSLVMNLALKSTSLDLAVPLNEEYKKSGTYHSQSAPDIDLSPQPLDIVKAGEWLKTIRTKVAENLAGKLKEKWSETFCSETRSPAGMKSASERVHACLRGGPAETPKFIDDWFRNRLSLGYAEATKILGN